MTCPRTKIVATLGPATDRPGVLPSLVDAGVDVVRLNLSHGTFPELEQRLSSVRELPRPPAVMVDTRGPEVRISFPGEANLHPGQKITIPAGDFQPREAVTTLEEGDRLILGDGSPVLEVTGTECSGVHLRVLAGGRAGGAVRVTLPERAEEALNRGRSILTAADLHDLELIVPKGVDFIALSMVRNVGDIIELREFLEERGHTTSVVAKIETASAVDGIDSILKMSDAVMVARGDLGLRLPPYDVPIIQKQLIQRANLAGKPVITATQMLESMIERQSPTRAEASDVANAILDGTDAVMLSGETAVGSYPVETVAVMARIALRAEEELGGNRLASATGPTITDALGRSAHHIAISLNASTIITATVSGYTTRMVARFRPRAGIVAVTPSGRVARQLALVWGVVPLVSASASSTDAVLEGSVAAALESGLVNRGDLVVLTAGLPPGVSGTTNLIKVEVAAPVLARGTGMGQGVAIGAVVQAGQDPPQGPFILVARSTDASMVPLMRRAQGVVAAEGGFTSHAAIVGLELGLPTLIGAGDAPLSLASGQVVTVDAGRGLLYDGEVRIPGVGVSEGRELDCS